MNRSAVIDTLRGCFAARSDVVAAYLFGSVARDEARADSVHRYLDVDPAIVRSVLVTNLDDFGTFVRSIRARLAELQG